MAHDVELAILQQLCKLFCDRRIGSILVPGLSVLRYEYQFGIIFGLLYILDRLRSLGPLWKLSINLCFRPWESNPAVLNVLGFQLPYVAWPQPTIHSQQHEATHLLVGCLVNRRELIDCEYFCRLGLFLFANRLFARFREAQPHTDWPVNHFVFECEIEDNPRSLYVIAQRD